MRLYARVLRPMRHTQGTEFAFMRIAAISSPLLVGRRVLCRVVKHSYFNVSCNETKRVRPRDRACQNKRAV